VKIGKAENGTPATPGILLAGGLARRMRGGDKPMRSIAGRSILARVIARLDRQCDGLILNANGDPARFAFFNANSADDLAERSGWRCWMEASASHAASGVVQAS